MTDSNKIEAEKQELNILVNRGISFEVDRITYQKPKGFLGRFKKRIPISEKLNYKIEEPTLSTLDRISAEQIELKIDESIMTSDNGLSEAKRLTNEHSRRLAKIVAFAVLGQDYVKTIQEGSRIRYEYDDKRLNELTDIFFLYIKPSKLMRLTVLLNTMSNLGDFMNSIRLMSAARTTMPIRIEEGGV